MRRLARPAYGDGRESPRGTQNSWGNQPPYFIGSYCPLPPADTPLPSARFENND